MIGGRGQSRCYRLAVRDLAVSESYVERKAILRLRAIVCSCCCFDAKDCLSVLERKQAIRRPNSDGRCLDRLFLPRDLHTDLHREMAVRCSNGHDSSVFVKNIQSVKAIEYLITASERSEAPDELQRRRIGTSEKFRRVSPKIGLALTDGKRGSIAHYPASLSDQLAGKKIQ